MGDTNETKTYEYEPGSGLDGLDKIAAQMASDEPEAPTLGELIGNDQEVDFAPQVESEAETEVQKEEEQLPVAESEIEAKQPEQSSYEPNYQYKFQDEMFEFDDRVKAAINSKEDEEYYRDLITRAKGMEIQKNRYEEVNTKVQEWEHKYSDLNTRSESNDQTIQYISNLMEGISRGDSQSFNNLLGLCNVNQDTLIRLGETLAKHITDPDDFVSQQQQFHQQRQQHVQQQTQNQYSEEAARLSRERTEFAIERALASDNVANIVEYVDSVAGKGSFVNEVKIVGEQMVRENPSLSFNDIPNIVNKVAEKYRAFIPQNNTQQAPVAPAKPEPVIKQQIIRNNTKSLPNAAGEQGVATTQKYVPGSGLEGLEKAYKSLTGKDL